jgi:hypothetical protein
MGAGARRLGGRGGLGFEPSLETREMAWKNVERRGGVKTHLKVLSVLRNFRHRPAPTPPGNQGVLIEFKSAPRECTSQLPDPPPGEFSPGVLLVK